MAPDKHDLSYYLKCMAGGVLACGVTHTGIVPLDLVKCRKQVYPAEYKSITAGFGKIKAQEGTMALTLGWLPTLIGYSLQGLGKFGFYEVFKDVYAKLLGEDKAVKYRKVGWAVSSACAELIADVLLCPFEATKVRIQTSKQGTFPTNFFVAFNKIKSNEGVFGLYKGIVPLWCRQVPYTIVKFVAFEEIVEQIYKRVLYKKPKNEYSRGTQLSVTFASGYLAGVFCAIVSHPADTIVSKLNNVKTDSGVTDAIKKIYADIGFKGLWAGLGARIIMIGTLTGFQWWIYNSFKTAVGLQATGGEGAKKH